MLDGVINQTRVYGVRKEWFVELISKYIHTYIQ